MSRQLIAGQREARGPRQPRLVALAPTGAPVVVPGKTTYPTAPAAVAAIRGMVEEIRGIDGERRELEQRRMRLQQRLADPGLFDHPKRGDAERRYEEFVAAEAGMVARMQALMLVVGDVYLALPVETRTGLGWAPVTSRYGMRAWLESCLAVGWLPEDEAPF